MNDPIDIKTQKIITQPSKNNFDKTLVLEVMEKNIITHWDTWGRFQQVWSNRAYNTFKDFDKYIVLLYLIRDYYQQHANKFRYQSYDEFYAFDSVKINKINLIKISTELNIPKETIRRKVNELQKDEILKREGKSIVLQKKLVGYQKPEKSLDALASFIHKKSQYLQGESWFGDAMSTEEIVAYTKKYFTILWLRFLNLQIPFLLRHRDNFRDLETWMIWGNVALHHQKNLNKFMDNSLLNQPIIFKNYFKKVIDIKISRGVNASSIADISGIPRATVIRKLRWLVQQKLVKKNKNLEYLLSHQGKINKNIEINFLNNQILVAEFLTDFFDYYKNSNFKP